MVSTGQYNNGAKCAYGGGAAAPNIVRIKFGNDTLTLRDLSEAEAIKLLHKISKAFLTDWSE